MKTVASCVGFSVFLEGRVQGAWELGATTPVMLVGLARANLAGSCLPEFGPSLLGEHLSESAVEAQPARALSPSESGFAVNTQPGLGVRGRVRKLVTAEGLISCPAFWGSLGMG